jgi:hypothetical protein
VIANKVKLHRDEALAMARSASEVCASKGKKWIKVPVDGSSDEELAGLILGRSGTLRAPAFRVGSTFVVGFHPEGYTEIFG